MARVWLLSFAAGCVLDRSGLASGAGDAAPLDRDAAVDRDRDGGDRDSAVDAAPELDAGPPLGPIVSVEAGEGRTCAIDRDGALYCWGRADFGALGVGTSTGDVRTPTRVEGTWQQVSLFGDHACALDSLGRAHCWGRGDRGALGVGTGLGYDTPVPVSGGPWQAIAVGSVFSCAIDGAGDQWCWGNLGPGGSPFTPAPIPDLPAVATLDCGDRYGCSIATSGITLCSGESHDNVLGRHADWWDQPVSTDGTAVAIAAGWQHTCVLDAGGAARCWGSAAEYAVGHPGGEPGLVEGAYSWTDISVGRLFTCGVTSERDVRCFGRNDAGQLGQGDTAPHPMAIVRVNLPPATDVAAGEHHACAVANGDLYCWGRNEDGQLGLGDSADRSIPTRVTFP
jgi:alpha-tubulin suppressor-like RCC1 family protein